MQKGNIREAFLGGNTSQGFFSFYDYIIDLTKAKRMFILKGGPGVGKSTFMKKIAERIIDYGFDVELMHCSSDNNSLDAIVIPDTMVAIVDGTAPHIIDPKYPGAVDEIINLGDFWDAECIIAKKEEIIKCRAEIGLAFNRAYSYLRAAAAIYNDTERIYSQAVNKAEVNYISWQICTELFGNSKPSVSEGKQRNLFASAITPNGFINYLPSILNVNKIYMFKGMPGSGTEKVLEKIRDCAIEKGHFVECYYCALIPTKLEHLVIPGVNTAITTNNKYHNTYLQPYLTTDFNENLNEAIILDNKDVLDFNESESSLLMNKAVETISKAKQLHDQMEKYYIPGMNYDAIQKCRDATLNKILTYSS